jgi:hypothetical protein
MEITKNINHFNGESTVIRTFLGVSRDNVVYHTYQRIWPKSISKHHPFSINFIFVIIFVWCLDFICSQTLKILARCCSVMKDCYRISLNTSITRPGMDINSSGCNFSIAHVHVCSQDQN